MGWNRAAMIAVVVVAACGGGESGRKKEPLMIVADATYQARTNAANALMAAINAHDPAAVEATLADEVSYGGLWFTDTECRRSLAVVGSLHGDGRSALARCLAPLSLALSTRAHPYPNVTVFTYDS